MKQFIILILGIFYSSIGLSQKVEYSYDGHGNRTQRKLVISQASSRIAPPSDSTKKEQMYDEGGQLAMKHGISVFPNPTQDQITISLSELKQDENKNTMVYVIDNTGKIVATKAMPENKTDIDLRGLKSGVYHIRVKFDKEELFYKVVKND